MQNVNTFCINSD